MEARVAGKRPLPGGPPAQAPFGEAELGEMRESLNLSGHSGTVSA
jgi:hypothetical protein